MKAPKRVSSLYLVLYAVALAHLGLSCASPPPVSRPDLGVDVPRQWTAVSARGEHAPEWAWWTRLGGAPLDSLVREALAHNHDLKAAAARLQAATARTRIAGSDALPQLGLEASGSRARQNFIGLPIPGSDSDVLSTRSTVLGVALNLTWELDVWGRIRAGQSAAMADEQAAAADLYAAHLSLAGQMVKTWLGVIEARQQVELARSTVESFRSSSDQIRQRYERGLRRTPLDLRLSLANVAGAEAVLEEWRGRLDVLRRQMELLLGRYPEGEVEVAENLPAVPGPIPAGLPAELLSRRPDLVAAERRLAAAGARVKEARAALYPRFSLTASGGTSSSELEDLIDSDFSVWRLAGSILQPIFQGGRLLGGVDLAEATQREALASFVDQALVAFAEVESSLAAEGYLGEREEALKTAADESRAAREIAEDRYARGLENLITVLESQRRSYRADRELLTVRRLRLENRVDLHLALGGGFRNGALARTTAPTGGSQTSAEEGGADGADT